MHHTDMKTLVESLFDKDLEKQGIYIGDVYELDEWTIPGREDKSLDILYSSFLLSDLKYEVDKSSWVKFLKPFSDQFKYLDLTLSGTPKINSKYFYCPLFQILTWIILCCNGKDEIIKRTTKFINNTKLDLKKHLTYYQDAKRRNDVIYRCEVDVLNGVGSQKTDIRMVVFKFYTHNPEYKDIIACMTLKRKD